MDFQRGVASFGTRLCLQSLVCYTLVPVDAKKDRRIKQILKQLEEKEQHGIIRKNTRTERRKDTDERTYQLR